MLVLSVEAMKKEKVVVMSTAVDLVADTVEDPAAVDMEVDPAADTEVDLVEDTAMVDHRADTVVV